MTETICLIHTGDKSAHIWDYWYYYWKKYYNCDFDTIFLSENETKDYPGVKFYCTGNCHWGEGLIDFLSHSPFESRLAEGHSLHTVLPCTLRRPCFLLSNRDPGVELDLD